MGGIVAGCCPGGGMARDEQESGCWIDDGLRRPEARRAKGVRCSAWPVSTLFPVPGEVGQMGCVCACGGALAIVAWASREPPFGRHADWPSSMRQLASLLQWPAGLVAKFSNKRDSQPQPASPPSARRRRVSNQSFAPRNIFIEPQSIPGPCSLRNTIDNG